MSALAAVGRTCRGAVADGWRGVRWYLREIGGEARWEAYQQRCLDHGHLPVSRAEFERARADAKAASPTSRCC